MDPGDTDTPMISDPPQGPEMEPDKGRPYKCRFCDYAATQRTHLRCHERTHTGEKPYKCNLCGYAAAQKTNLNSHKRVHSGERPYKCKMCPYAAIQRSNLTSHYRAKHGVQKPTIYIEHDSPPRMQVDQQDGNTLSDIADAHGIEQVQGFSNAVFSSYPNQGEHLPGFSMVRTPPHHIVVNGNHIDVPVSVGSYTARQSERTSSTASSCGQGEEIMDLTCIKKEEAVGVSGEESQPLDFNKDETSLTHTSSGSGRQRQDSESPGISVDSDGTHVYDSQEKGQTASIHNHDQQSQETQKNYISVENSPHHHVVQRNNSYPGSSGNTESAWRGTRPFVRENSHDESSQPSDEYSAAQFSSPQVQTQVPSLRSSPGVSTQRHMCRYCDLSFGDYLMYTVHMGFHTYGDPLRCNMCGVKYRIPLEFFVHTHSGVHGSTADQ